MKRLRSVVTVLALVVATSAHGEGLEPREFGWMIVDHEATSMSSMKDLDRLERLQREYGDEFLYIRDDGDRYVIRDRALMRRAWDAQRPVRDAKGLVRKVARGRANVSLYEWDERADQSRLARKRAKLSKEPEARGRDADDGLDKAMKNMKHEMQGILRNAKARGLAEHAE